MTVAAPPPVATADVIDQILGPDVAASVAALRAQKSELAGELQEYYASIFAPSDRSAGEFSAVDRALVAIRVAAHTRSTAVVAWYTQLAQEHGADPDLIARTADVATPWETDRDARLDAAIARADLVTLHPDRTEASDIQTLRDAGFSPAAILSISQVIAFVSYQLRLIAALRALGDAR